MANGDALADTIIKLVGGFVLGFAFRGIIHKPQHPKPVVIKSKKSAAGAAGSAAPARPKPIPRPTEELKMVLCVNQVLKMGTGKVGAQCAHAACGVLQDCRQSHEVAIRQWSMLGQAKIALKVQDDKEMQELEAKARAMGMPTYIVHDAGRTQIPAGSQTVLAIGPAPKSQLDTVTGHLKLL